VGSNSRKCGLMYGPFVPGRFTVAERSMQAFDTVRRDEVWRNDDALVVVIEIQDRGVCLVSSAIDR
jgi:hypothetical protein